MYSNAEIVEIMRKKCKEKGLSLTKLEEKLGYGNGRLSKWAGAKRPMSKKIICEVAEALDVSTMELAGEAVELPGMATASKPVESSAPDNDSLWEYLDQLRTRSEMRMLFSVTKDATKSQVEAIVKFVEAMKNDD